MDLRPATRSDAAALAALSVEVWIGTYLRHGVGPAFAEHVLRTYAPATLARWIADPAQTLRVAAARDGAVGYVRLLSAAAPPVPGLGPWEVATLYVQPRHHGRGLGRRLLGAACATARAAGADHVWLTTNSGNAPALGFYATQGFEAVGTTDYVIDGTGYENTVLRLGL
ncbi:GNAT family N-acetyltransferase [Jannaschia sp. Os4]|uniref:GNAT family N-acetyltransferase n=1 Tax=Jannaschia sp. Os4 TaxID=2807617 RepID=UPI00193AAB1A|nr:GNAT family N-acetyltransferase [Jannaschia sp. Os4]MBM2575303.1 GNAT family N-acetyltransferase [Jannaschia sp. Os4]